MVRLDKKISRGAKRMKKGVKSALGKQGTKALNTVVKKGVNTGRKAVKGVVRTNQQARQLEKAIPMGIKQAVKKEGRKIKYTI